MDEFIDFISGQVDMEKLKLSQDEGLYKRLVDTLPVAIYLCDKSGQITFLNKKAVVLLGHVGATEDQQFCVYYKVRQPDGTYVPQHKTPMAMVLENGKTYRDVETLIERSDGSKFYASVNIHPLFDKTGQLEVVINIFQDISNWKFAQMARLESERQYRHLIQSLSAAVYTCDAQGRVTLFNNAAAALWGRKPKIGEDLWCGSWKIYYRDGSPMPLSECPMAIAIKEGRSVVGEIILVERPDGTRRYVAPHPQPILDSAGTLKGAVNMLVDVTEEISKEQVLRESEERLRLAIDAAELGTWDMDIATGAIITSERHRQIIGYDKESLWDRKKYLDRVHPDDVNLAEQAFKDAMESGTLFYEARILKEEQTRWIRINGKTIFRADIPVRILGTIMDITLQREMKEELEKTVAERTRELRRVNNQLEKSNHDLEQFAYIASHDLQEPLRKIQTFVTLLEQVNDETDRSKYISKIHSSAQSMSMLIKDVLAYSRLSKIPEFERTDLNEILRNVRIEFDLLIQEKRATVIAGNLPSVHGIARQLSQMFSNILSNSLKFSTHYPVIEITGTKLSTEEINLYPQLKKGSEYVKLIFKDNGIGFDQKYADQIFNIFQRLNTRESFSGSGVGLALCKKIIENHHGLIMAESEPGQGTIITVILPS